MIGYHWWIQGRILVLPTRPKFFHFHAVFGKIYEIIGKSTHPGSCPPSPGNPGSATGYDVPLSTMHTGGTRWQHRVTQTKQLYK